MLGGNCSRGSAGNDPQRFSDKLEEARCPSKMQASPIRFPGRTQTWVLEEGETACGRKRYDDTRAQRGTAYRCKNRRTGLADFVRVRCRGQFRDLRPPHL